MESHRNAWGEKQSSNLQLGETFNINPSSDSDAQSDAAEITYSCAFCDQEYPDEETLASHMECHTAVQSPNSFICTDKPAEVHTEHQKEDDEIADEYLAPQSLESFSCKYCGKQCNSKQKLSYHERTHRIKRTFRCSICRRGFDKREQYDRHVRTHSNRAGIQIEPQKGEHGAKTFDCKLCGKQFHKKLSLSYHERTHSIKRRFRCSLCNRGFNQRETYDRHLRTHSTRTAVQTEHLKEEESRENFTEQSTFRCKYCGKYCTTKMNLSYHERTHKIKRTFRCSICRRGFDSRQAYDRHIIIHSQTELQKLEGSSDECSAQRSLKPFSCRYCGKQVDTKLKLSYHERSHKVKRTFCCSVCNRGFNSKLVYEQHIRMHSDKPIKTEHQKEEAMDENSPQQIPESFSCKYCGKPCETKLSLSYHERSHKIKRSFRCSVCNRGFDSEQKYERHIRDHQKGEKSDAGYSTSENPRLFSCIDCGARFPTELRLSEHKKTHRIEMAFRCSVCEKGFNRRQTYERHIKLHSTKPSVQTEPQEAEEMDEDSTPESFSCKYCGKRFNTKQSLSYHERTHKIKRTFSCFVCNKGFNKRPAYVQHLRMHQDEYLHSDTDNLSQGGLLKPFKCDQCGVRFNAKQYLVRHMKYHTSEPHFCKYCDKMFSTKASCVMHMKSHNLDMPYSCLVCKEKFKFPGRLVVHMKKHGIVDVCVDGYSAQQSPALLSSEYKIEFPFPCSICKTQITGRGSYEEHIRMHSEDIDSTSLSDQSFDKEIQGNSGEIIFSCALCDKELPTEEALKTHMDDHEKTVKQRLGSHMEIPSKDESHMNVQTEEKPYSCKSNLEHHTRIHTGEQSFSCSVCLKKFSSGFNLKRHMALHKSRMRIQTGHYRCSVCNKKFDCRSKLEEHARVHKEERSFSCSVCLKKFSSESNLKRHMPVHKSRVRIQTAETSHSCSVCNKAFSCQSKLQEHTRIHTEEETVGCPVSPKRFSSAYVPKRNTPPPPEREDKLFFDCEDCGKRYSSKLGLLYHSRTHLKQQRRTFHCSVCNAEFNKKLAYDWHVKMHCPQLAVKTEHVEGDEGGERSLAFSGEDGGGKPGDSVTSEVHKITHEMHPPFSCSVCRGGFEKQDEYEAHVKTHEGAKETDPDDKGALRDFELPSSGTADSGLLL
uniref:C2H2-type domain-containing protein n=1 Tax=Neogobius melanostomus TaxID=47308 RepID=A0A8C6TVU4_9GOBI